MMIETVNKSLILVQYLRIVSVGFMSLICGSGL